MHDRLAVWMMGLVVFAAPLRALATDEDDAARVTEVITIRHADAQELTGMLEAVGPEGLWGINPMTSTNQIVVQGTAACLAEIRRLTAELDVASFGRESVTQLIPVRAYPLPQLADLVADSLADKSSRIGVDGLNRRLVVTASPQEVRRIEQLVSQLDRPSAALTVYLYFFRGRLGLGGTTAPDVPPALQAIVKTLGENGFSNVNMLAPIVIRTNDARRFDSSSVLLDKAADPQPPSGGAPGGPAAPNVFNPHGKGQLAFKVGGQADLLTDSGQVSLALDTGFQGFVSGTQVSFALDTVLVLNLDQYVLLAAAPGTTSAGDAVALVVRVVAEP